MSDLANVLRCQGFTCSGLKWLHATKTKLAVTTKIICILRFIDISSITLLLFQTITPVVIHRLRQLLFGSRPAQDSCYKFLQGSRVLLAESGMLFYNSACPVN